MSGTWVLRLRECETLRREERRLRCGPRLGALLSPAYLHASEVIVRVSADLVKELDIDRVELTRRACSGNARTKGRRVYALRQRLISMTTE